MQVLENQHHRAGCGDALDETAHRKEQTLAIRDLALDVESEQDAEMLRHGSPVAPDQIFDRLAELAHRHIGSVIVENAHDLLDLAGKRAISAAISIRQRSAAERPATGVRNMADELETETGLADARRAEHGDQLQCLVPHHPLPRLVQDAQFPGPRNEWNRARLGFAR